MPLAPLQLWRRVAADPALLAQAVAAAPGDVNAVTRLRRDHDADTVAVALDLVRARAKAETKFPGRASALLADPAGVEQATSGTVAAYKARRFAQVCGRVAGRRVVDLGCGIGGDAMGLADAGLKITAVDLDPVRAAMAAHNAGVPAVVADARDWDSISPPSRTPSGAALHLDPARRTAAGRTHRLADTLPPPDVVAALIRAHASAGVAVKLSPAVDLAELADALPPGELEFISEAGRLVQAVLWTGGLAGPEHAARRATLLDDGQTHTLSGEPGEPAWSEPRRLLFTVDPAAERARLLQHLGLPAIHPQLGLLTADEDPQSAWLTAFELVEQLPWREKRVAARLRALGAGIVEVKTRGGAVDPDHAQKRLRGTGKTPFTVFVLRWDRRVVALITRRLAGPCGRTSR